MSNVAEVMVIERAGHRLPRLILADGCVEGLKWLALILMTGDHINKYLLNDSWPLLFKAGRLAMPLFVAVLAYNLARPGVYKSGAYGRTMRRLLLCGLVASPAFIGLGGLLWGWWPLNILFALLAMTLVCLLIERGDSIGRWGSIGVFVLAGGMVEFWWPALAFGVAVWMYARQPSVLAGVVALVSCALFAIINRNSWALAAIPVMLVASTIELRLPRCKWAFYVYYPAHLTAIWLIRIPLRHAGYLFFT